MPSQFNFKQPLFVGWAAAGTLNRLPFGPDRRRLEMPWGTAPISRKDQIAMTSLGLRPSTVAKPFRVQLAFDP